MMFAFLILAVWHPGEVLVGPESEFPKKIKGDKQKRKDTSALEKDESRAELGLGQ